jgi:heptosyltransferase-3
MVLQNLEVVRCFGIDTLDERLDMRITAEADDFVSSLFARHGFTPDDTVVHVHPTSRWFFKCWKDEYMAEVISWMLDRGIKVVVTSSPDAREMEKGARIMSLVTSTAQPVNLLGGTSLKQLAALSKRSALFLGVDSAPMHMAAAVQTPVVALFGPSHEALWSPWGENATVIAPPMACKPCRKGSCEGVDLRECMTAITPEAVISAIQEKLHVH